MADLVGDAPLGPALERLRGGADPVDYLAERYDRLEATEATLSAWVHAKPREQARAEAAALAARHPDGDGRPSLFGVPVGVKDIVHVDGLPTRAGSTLPAGAVVGGGATVVDRLRAAGAYVLGKTVTAEFAYATPGPTRNPHDPDRTPGGSSSGSAAAVAAGHVPLALGTQTVGSVVRPATFCGLVGFVPTYGRVPTDGVVPVSPSVDRLGTLTRDVAGARAAAAVLADDWDDERASPPDEPASSLALAAPPADDPYLAQARPAGRERFEAHLDALAAAGHDVRRVPLPDDVAAVNERHETVVAAEAALAHESWYEAHGDRYADESAELVERGRATTAGELARGRRSRGEYREALTAALAGAGADCWVSPGAPGPAPTGIDSTGDPVMNLPWSHAGLPTVALPAGGQPPFGVQVAAPAGADERLLARSGALAAALS